MYITTILYTNPATTNIKVIPIHLVQYIVTIEATYKKHLLPNHIHVLAMKSATMKSATMKSATIYMRL